MPRTYPPRRTWVGVRMDPADVQAVDERAERETVDRSEMVRRLVRLGLTVAESDDRLLGLADHHAAEHSEGQQQWRDQDVRECRACRWPWTCSQRTFADAVRDIVRRRQPTSM